jgi:titin
LATPTLSTATSAVGAFSFTITNYDAANGYTLSSTAGTASRSGSTVTVSGLSNGASATVSVTATRASFVSSSTATQSGSSLNQVATPTFGSYTINYPGGRYKYKISIANYDATNTYTVSVSAGSFTRTNELITVTGSADNQNITVYVTASRAGFANSTQAAYANNTSGTPCAAGTYLYGPVYYASVGGVPGACGYNGVCDGNYGIGLNFVSGPCAFPEGDYCAGC